MRIPVLGHLYIPSNLKFFVLLTYLNIIDKNDKNYGVAAVK